jgi:hypothetical protein
MVGVDAGVGNDLTKQPGVNISPTVACDSYVQAFGIDQMDMAADLVAESPAESLE